MKCFLSLGGSHHRHHSTKERSSRAAAAMAAVSELGADATFLSAHFGRLSHSTSAQSSQDSHETLPPPPAGPAYSTEDGNGKKFSAYFG